MLFLFRRFRVQSRGLKPDNMFLVRSKLSGQVLHTELQKANRAGQPLFRFRIQSLLLKRKDFCLRKSLRLLCESKSLACNFLRMRLRRDSC